jgi:hypothetical protein
VRVATIGLALAVGLSGCGGEPAPKGPPYSVAVDQPFVPGVNPVVNMTIKINRSRRSGELVVLAGKAVRQIGTDLIAGKPPVPGEFKAINFTIVGPAAQDAGSVGNKIMHLSYGEKDLRQSIHFGGDDDTLLAGADDLGWWAPVNDDVIRSYCDDHSGGAFCKRALEK